MNKCACVPGTCDRMMVRAHLKELRQDVSFGIVLVCIPTNFAGCFATVYLYDILDITLDHRIGFGVTMVLSGLAAAKATKTTRMRARELDDRHESMSKLCRHHH